MFAGKARAYPSEAPFKCSTLRMVACLKNIPLQGTAVVLSFNTFHFVEKKYSLTSTEKIYTVVMEQHTT
jgi:hypothetical protein